METKRIFYEGMDVDPADHNLLQTYAQDSLDHVVADTVVSRQTFAGFEVTKTGPTAVSVAGGRLYSGGKRYSKTALTPFDFITALPLAGKKIVSIVGWGQESDTNVTAREFLIDEETLDAEPRPVALDRARLVNIQSAQGNEAPDPTEPIIDVGYTRIANVLLSTTGVDSITMIEDNRAPKLDLVEGRVDAAEAFAADAGPRIATLASDLAKLANQLKMGASGPLLSRMLLRLADLDSKIGIPDAAADSAADYFLTPDETDLAHVNSSCRVMEGIRFPHDNSDEEQLQVFDPLNPKSKVVNGILFPAYDRELWISSGTYASEVQIAAYSYQTHNMVQKTLARQRIRYGEEFTVCSNNVFWGSGTVDWANWTFNRGGETFNILGYVNIGDYQTFHGVQHGMVRLRKVWTDSYSETYWDRITIDHVVNGAQIAETWQQGQDIWLEAIGLYFTRLAAAGTADISICEVSDYGLPNIKKVIGSTTLLRENMRLYPLETVVPLGPLHLEQGKRYAVLVTTAADHWVAMVPGEQFTRGTFFTVLDGAYAQGDGTRDLMMNLYRCKFRNSRTVIELNSLSLSGGILSIDINADAAVPSQTNLEYEIQVVGVWYPLSAVDVFVLGQGGQIPPLLPLRAVFNGSVDMMPALKLTGSKAVVSRPGTSLTHISSIRTLPAASTQIRVIERLEGFDAAHHTAAVKLRSGAGYNTITAATSFSDVNLGNDQYGQNVVERTYVFNLGGAITSYQIQTEGTTDSAQVVYHVGWRKDYAM